MKNKLIGLNKGFWWKNPKGVIVPPESGLTIVDQDFTTYSESHTDIVINSATQVTYSSVTWTDYSLFWKDFGVDYFAGDFEVYFDFNQSYASNGAGIYFSAFRNEGNTSYGVRDVLDTGNDVLCVYAPPASSTTFNIHCYEALGVGSINLSPTAYTGSINTTYYIKFVRSIANNTLTVYVYSDEARTNLLGSNSITLAKQVAFRYLFPVNGHGTYVSSTVNQVNGIFSNLKLGLPL